MKLIISWILRLVAAAIMAQTLYFKFAGAEESRAIFSELGMEPYGRILIGVLELIASILLLVPGTVSYGAILAWGLMSGAIMGHITQLGFAGDRGQLFLLAVVTWISASVLIFLHKNQIPILRHMFAKADRAD
ncbi:MAG: DoxX family protein [Verrucomicrobiae bacterium]|nr:DoxX family protein [Verrucomicrobiae bacterium]